MRGTCRLCGDTKRLTELGVCEWEHGCEHRRLVAEARLLREVEAIVEAEAVRRTEEWHESLRQRGTDFYKHPSTQGFWKAVRPADDTGGDPRQFRRERINKWIDQWLQGDDQ